MTGAAEVQVITDVSIVPEHVQYLAPRRHTGGRISVANDVHSMVSSGKQQIDTVGSPQEAAFMLLVAPDQRDDDYLGLFTLKVVHGGQSESLEQRTLCYAQGRRKQGSHFRVFLGFFLSIISFTSQTVDVAIIDNDFCESAKRTAQLP